MPVEIKELVIRAVARSGAAEGRGVAEDRGVPGTAGGTAGAGASTASEQEALVEACVKEVLRILRKSKER